MLKLWAQTWPPAQFQQCLNTKHLYRQLSLSVPQFCVAVSVSGFGPFSSASMTANSVLYSMQQMSPKPFHQNVCLYVNKSPKWPFNNLLKKSRGIRCIRNNSMHQQPDSRKGPSTNKQKKKTYTNVTSCYFLVTNICLTSSQYGCPPQFITTEIQIFMFAVVLYFNVIINLLALVGHRRSVSTVFGPSGHPSHRRIFGVIRLHTHTYGRNIRYILQHVRYFGIDSSFSEILSSSIQFQAWREGDVRHRQSVSFKFHRNKYFVAIFIVISFIFKFM